MRRQAYHLTSAGLAFLALAVSTRVLHAQYYAQLGSGAQTAFLFATGVSFPAGAIASRVDPEINFMLGFQLREGNAPIAGRIDLTFQEFSGPDGWASINALTFDVVGLAEHKGEAQFHVIAGLGPYYTTGSGLSGPYIGYRSTTVFGINAGGGFSYGKKVSLFTELRYHLLFQDGRVLQMIPFNIGIALRG